jgi:hypothetical protein
MARPKGSAKTAGSGRKKGQPNRIVTDIKLLAQGFGAEAIGILVGLMRDADFETVRVSAAKELLDRAYGKAVQPVEADVQHTIRYEISLAFGQPTHLQSDDALSPRVQGSARNGKALVHNGGAS